MGQSTGTSGGTSGGTTGTPSKTKLEISLKNKKYDALNKVGGIIFIDSGVFKLMVIRVKTDQINALDRICTHKGSDMHLSSEGSWDQGSMVMECTNHNSRYNAEGKAIKKKNAGQADLHKYKVDFNQKENKFTIHLS